MPKQKPVVGGTPPVVTLGFDISSVCVGYAIFHDLNLHSYGKFVQVGKDHGERLWHFGEWVEALLRKTQPNHVVVELPHGGVYRAKTFAVLTMYLSQLLLAHFKVFGYELPEANRLYPKTIKAELKVPPSGDHDTNKQLMVDYINKMFKLSLRWHPQDKTKLNTDDDIADAIALAVAWLLKRGLDDGRYDPDPDRTRKRATKAAKG